MILLLHSTTSMDRLTKDISWKMEIYYFLGQAVLEFTFEPEEKQYLISIFSKLFHVRTWISCSFITHSRLQLKL